MDGGSIPPSSTNETTAPRREFFQSTYTRARQGEESQLKVGYVVLYVRDSDACVRFWTEQVGMIEKSCMQAGGFWIVKVGFANQDFDFELVPRDLMKDNPNGLDLATPSIAFRVDNLDATRAELVARGVQATEVDEHSGIPSFAFPDNEDRWFAVIKN